MRINPDYLFLYFQDKIIDFQNIQIQIIDRYFANFQKQVISFRNVHGPQNIKWYDALIAVALSGLKWCYKLGHLFW